MFHLEEGECLMGRGRVFQGGKFQGGRCFRFQGGVSEGEVLQVSGVSGFREESVSGRVFYLEEGVFHLERESFKADASFGGGIAHPLRCPWPSTRGGEAPQ